MSVRGREATDDYSKGNRPGPLSTLAAGLGLAGAAMAVVATFTTVIKIVVLTVEPAHFTGYDRYGPALLLLAAFAVVMVAGGWRGARPAMAALGLAGVGVLLIVALIDLPHINDEDVWNLAQVYEDAQASAGVGFYFETAAGVLMMLGGAMMLLLAPPRRGPRPEPMTREERRAARAARTEPDPAEPASVGGPIRPGAAFDSPTPAEPPPRGTDDWFAADPPASSAPARKRQGGLVGRLRGRDR